ncbi:MAG TPA: PAS domain S-box protein, partial [Anaerolineae bacterium]
MNSQDGHNLPGQAPSESAQATSSLPTSSLPVSQLQAQVAAQQDTINALEQERDFLRQIIDLNPHFMFAKDRQGRFTLVNQAVAEAYGTTVANLLGKTDADFNPNEEEVGHFRRIDLQVMDSLQEQLIPEEPITDATGKVRWLQTVKRPIIEESGVANQLLGIATDITQRKLAKDALTERLRYEAGLASALQALLAGTEDALTEALHHLLAAADTCRVYIFENSEDEASGPYITKTHEICAPGVSPQTAHLPYRAGIERWRNELSQGRRISGLVADMPQVEQNILESHDVISILVLPITVQGQWYGFIGFDDTKTPRSWREADIQLLQTAAAMIGVTIERRQAQAALEEQRAFLRQVIDLNPSFIFAKDRQGRFTLANKALADAYGTTVDQMVGKTDADFNPNLAETEHFRRDDLDVINSRREKF